MDEDPVVRDVGKGRVVRPIRYGMKRRVLLLLMLSLLLATLVRSSLDTTSRSPW